MLWFWGKQTRMNALDSDASCGKVIHRNARRKESLNLTAVQIHRNDTINTHRLEQPCRRSLQHHPRIGGRELGVGARDAARELAVNPRA